MNTGQKWVVVRIDGKIAAVSKDYRLLARISEQLSRGDRKEKGKSAGKGTILFNEIKAETVDMEDIWEIKNRCNWEDLMLFGTDFQKKVWRQLWELTHNDGKVRLISYSDFAELCQNKAGVRAVAHAIGLNPVSVIIPCHLVIPKESIDKIMEIHKKAEGTIFKGDDLCINSILSDSSIDFGEYAFGRKFKRELILKELA